MAGPTSIYSGRAETIDQIPTLLIKIWYQISLFAGSIPGGSAGGTSTSGLPYGADEQVITNAVGGPGPTVIQYKKAGVLVMTRTLTYTGSGPTDVLIGTKDT